MTYARLLFLVLICGVSLKAQPVVHPVADQLVELGPKAFILDDPTLRLTFSDVASRPNSAFRLSHQEKLNFGHTNSRIWLKFRLDNTLPDSLFLLFRTQDADYVDLYVVSETGVVTEQHSGMLRPFKNRYFLTNTVVLPLGQRLRTIFLALRDDNILHFSVLLAPIRPIVNQLQNESLFNGAVMGLMLVMVIVNLFVYGLVRDRVYLLYAVYVTLSCLTFMSFEGLLYNLLWPSVPALNNGRLYILITALTFGAAIWFSMNFLRTREFLPTFYRYFLGLLALVALTTLLRLLDVPGLERSFYGLTLIGFLSLLVLGIWTYRQGYRPARYYLLAWSFYIAGAMTSVLALLDVLAFTNTWVVYGYQIGAACEAILLTLALADRLQTYQKEYQTAQYVALQRAQENEQLLAQNNELLEEKLHDEHRQEPLSDDVRNLLRIMKEDRERIHKIAIPTLDGILLFPTGDITWLEAAGSYTTIHFANQKTVLASRGLAEFDHLCGEGEPFFRTHKSHIVNLNHVVKYLRGDGGQVMLDDGSTVDVSRRLKPDLLKRLVGEE
ncbi:7TM diverse intracellular signaling domain-containing protein [Spirosoma validum]|uniref:LytTR family transcriptional regulator DNA-binding domain-containing protein n=1 Tax=Spirosoma validum TaxID=2771355 RepID=A0A927AX58_9BACT|nr:7TM diverse intracellular signaling domain-containing protein [Spirosoma validum]MBD2751461.1 LytTR family transcriptional regulator DNA-binding domain-containing protein [Spirosoma validum]